MRSPDFFIVGAPKCGTTAMANYLAQHPDIFMATKELHHFGSDLAFRDNKPTLTAASYLDHFAAARKGQICGEASVWYLYSKRAAVEIKVFAPHAKIIVMLRNPVDMLYSLFFQNRWHGDESLPTFEDALAAEYDRRAGQKIPYTTAPGPIQTLYYREVGRFGEQVKRYLDEFGPGNVRIVLFEDFVADTAGVYKELLEFLGVDGAFCPEFPVVNASKTVKSQLLWRLMKTPPPWLRSAWRRLLPAPARGAMIAKLQNANRRVQSRPPLCYETRSQLLESLSDDIEKLEILLGRDLSSWRSLSGKGPIP